MKFIKIKKNSVMIQFIDIEPKLEEFHKELNSKKVIFLKMNKYLIILNKNKNNEESKSLGIFCGDIIIGVNGEINKGKYLIEEFETYNFKELTPNDIVEIIEGINFILYLMQNESSKIFTDKLTEIVKKCMNKDIIDNDYFKMIKKIYFKVLLFEIELSFLDRLFLEFVIDKMNQIKE